MFSAVRATYARSTWAIKPQTTTKQCQVTKLLLLTTLYKMSLCEETSAMSVWTIRSSRPVVHTFKILSTKGNALLTPGLPLPEATLPQEGRNQSHLSFKGLLQALHIAKVTPTEPVLEVGE